MDDDDESHSISDGLKRIARILDVPVASFFASEASPTAEQNRAAPTDGDVEQALSVMRLFLRLNSTQARARCVSFIVQELLRNSPSIDPASDD